MKKNLLFIMFCFSVILGFAQTESTYIYDGRGNLIDGTHLRTKPGKSITLQDSGGNIFILDSLHINITAMNSKGDIIWKTDPWKDNKIREYRTKRPYIVTFKLIMEDGVEKIRINYINTQFGTLEKKTGKFFFMGQD